MRVRPAFAFAAAIAVAATVLVGAQGDPDRVIPGGGIFAPGWTGKIDAGSVRQGRVLNDAKFTQEANTLHVITGPATTFWNPANTASGDYTVKASFMEPRFMELNSHPHLYRIFIGGNGMGTDSMTLVYRVTVRQRPGARPRLRPGGLHAAAAVRERGGPQGRGCWPARHAGHHVDGQGRPSAECSINGTVIAGYDKAQLVTTGKLQSTDGVFGIRFTHNVEAIITGFSMTKG